MLLLFKVRKYIATCCFYFYSTGLRLQAQTIGALLIYKSRTALLVQGVALTLIMLEIHVEYARKGKNVLFFGLILKFDPFL